MTDLCSEKEKQAILDQIPQKKPFRFIDSIVELSADHAIGEYTFGKDEEFFEGSSPETAVTPQTILVETMAQTGLVALSLHLMTLEGSLTNRRTFFTEFDIKFHSAVRPGDTVRTFGEKVFYRRNKLKAKVEMKRLNGELVASGMVAGMAIPVN